MGFPKLSHNICEKYIVQTTKYSHYSFIVALLEKQKQKNKTKQEVQILSASVSQGERGRDILSGHCSIKHIGQAKSQSSHLLPFHSGTKSECVGDTVSSHTDRGWQRPETSLLKTPTSSKNQVLGKHFILMIQAA